ncbi:MAG: ferredoxin [Actinomycetota bacterium]
MKVSVNFDSCASTGACTQMCPEVFEIRTDGFLHVLIENPGSELHEAVKSAEEICPTGAITIEA